MVKDLVQRATDPNVFWMERESYYEKIGLLPPALQRQAYRQIAVKGDADMSSQACVKLIRLHDPGAMAITMRQMKRWRPDNDTQVLMSVSQDVGKGNDAPGAEEFAVAEILKSTRKPGKSVDKLTARYAAALLLFRLGVKVEDQLSDMLLKKFPNERGSWLIAIASNVHPDTYKSLAQSIFNDPKADMYLRVLAATLEARSDTSAADFIAATQEEYYKKYSDADFSKSFQGKIAPIDETSAKKVSNGFAKYNNDLVTLTLLMFRNPNGLSFTQKCWDAKNTDLNLIAQFMLARFYPDALLSGLSANKNINQGFIALMVLKYPAYQKRALKYITPQTLEQEKKELRKSGVEKIDLVFDTNLIF